MYLTDKRIVEWRKSEMSISQSFFIRMTWFLDWGDEFQSGYLLHMSQLKKSTKISAVPFLGLSSEISMKKHEKSIDLWPKYNFFKVQMTFPKSPGLLHLISIEIYRFFPRVSKKNASLTTKTPISLLNPHFPSLTWVEVRL